MENCTAYSVVILHQAGGLGVTLASGKAWQAFCRVAAPGVLLPAGELQGVLKQAMPSLGVTMALSQSHFAPQILPFSLYPRLGD